MTTAFRLFIFALIFSPLAFGAVEPWSMAIMELAAFLALLLILIKNIKEKQPFLLETPGIVPLLILLAYIAFQLIPLPPGFMKFLSPRTFDLYRETVFLHDPSGWVPLTLNRKATLAEFFRIGSYVAFYIISVQLLSQKEHLRKTVAILAGFAGFLSFFAILQHVLSNGRIYWFREQMGSMFGPYVNRNHYAGLMEMLFPLVMALFLFYKPRAPGKSIRQRIVAVFDMRMTNIYALLGFAAVLAGTSVFLTLSRSGIVCLCISMVLFGAILFRNPFERKRGAFIVAVFALIFLAVGWFGWDPVMDRFERIRDAHGNISELRLLIWKDSIYMLRDYPLTGTGFGTFVNAFPRYRTVAGDKITDHAHNDYLELVSDGGVTALLICVWFMIVFFYKTWKIFLSRRGSYSVYVFAAAMTGIVSILLHSITDFNLHIGANGLYLFLFAGLAVSAANTRLHKESSGTYLPQRAIPLSVTMPSFLIVLLSAFLFHLGIAAGNFQATSVRAHISREASRSELLSLREKIALASSLDPLEAKYPYVKGNIESLLQDYEGSAKSYQSAVNLNPSHAEYLQKLGLALSGSGKDKLADKMLRASLKYDAANPAMGRRYAVWLLAKGRSAEAVAAIRGAMAIEPLQTKESLTILVLRGFSDRDIFNALPRSADSFLQFGDYSAKTGNAELAEEAYREALSLLSVDRKARKNQYCEISGFYLKGNKPAEALTVLRRASEAFPDNVDLRLRIADVYIKLEMAYSAAEEYRKILLAEPQNREAKAKLDRLLLKMKG